MVLCYLTLYDAPFLSLDGAPRICIYLFRTQGKSGDLEEEDEEEIRKEVEAVEENEVMEHKEDAKGRRRLLCKVL